MIRISSEAVRDKTPVMDIGHAIRELLLRLGIEPSNRADDSVAARGDKPCRMRIISFLMSRRFSGCR